MTSITARPFVMQDPAGLRHALLADIHERVAGDLFQAFSVLMGDTRVVCLRDLPPQQQASYRDAALLAMQSRVGASDSQALSRMKDALRLEHELTVDDWTEDGVRVFEDVLARVVPEYEHHLLGIARQACAPVRGGLCARCHRLIPHLGLCEACATQERRLALRVAKDPAWPDAE